MNDSVKGNFVVHCWMSWCMNETAIDFKIAYHAQTLTNNGAHSTKMVTLNQCCYDIYEDKLKAQQKVMRLIIDLNNDEREKKTNHNPSVESINSKIDWTTYFSEWQRKKREKKKNERNDVATSKMPLGLLFLKVTFHLLFENSTSNCFENENLWLSNGILKLPHNN